MNLVILGATGHLGAAVVDRAVADGHSVTAYARRPEAVASRDGVRVVGGPLDDVAAMASAFTEADAVISCVGAKGLMQRALPTIASALGTANVPRFVLVSGFGVGDTKTKASPFARLIYRTVVGSLFDDKDRAEKAVLPTLGTNWAVAYPVNLKGGARLASADVVPLDAVASVPGLPTLPFANVAEALLQLAGDDGPSGRRMLITTPGGWRPVAP